MANRRVRVSYGRTIQSAPYESIRLDVAIEKDVADNENLLEAVDKSVQGLKQYVKTTIAKTIQEEM